MPILDWPRGDAAEHWEIESFIDCYGRFPEHRSFEIVKKRERPDWLLRDVNSGEYVTVELTSVYDGDRSVPDVHMHEGDLQIPALPATIAAYGDRIAQKVATKVDKARRGYDTKFPLFLSIYVNEYISIHLVEKEWEQIIRTHEAVFDHMTPFAEVILWPLPNKTALRVRPAGSGCAPCATR